MPRLAVVLLLLIAPAAALAHDGDAAEIAATGGLVGVTPMPTASSDGNAEGTLQPAVPLPRPQPCLQGLIPPARRG